VLVLVTFKDIKVGSTKGINKLRIRSIKSGTLGGNTGAPIYDAEGSLLLSSME
jgi:hypothetical protein